MIVSLLWLFEGLTYSRNVRFFWTSADTWLSFITTVLYCFCCVFPSFFSSVLSSDAATLLPCSHFLVHPVFRTFAAFLKVQWNTISRQSWWTKLLWQVSARYGDTRHTSPPLTEPDTHTQTCTVKVMMLSQKPNVDSCVFPGHYLIQHCSGSSPTKCKPCDNQRYIQTHNMEWSCDFCGSCSKCESFKFFLQALATFYSNIINCVRLKDCVKALVYL